MTTYDVLVVLGRRWPVVLVGLAASGLLAMALLGRPGVYTTRVDVVLVPPRSAYNAADTSLVASSEGLIALAGVVERLINAHRTMIQTTSQEVSLVGTGVRDGVIITLPNSGGQWSYNFNSPMLTVQAAGSDRDEVIARRTAAVEDVAATLRAVQHGVPVGQRVRTQVVPEGAPVVLASGHPARAAAAALLIGGALTVLAAMGWETFAQGRGRGRGRAPARSMRDRRLRGEDAVRRPPAAPRASADAAPELGVN